MVITVVLHIALIYAMIHGLARKIVDIVTPPLETKIIEEIKPPEPDKPPPPPPKLETPPPPFIPPPEVNIQMSVPLGPTITAVAPTPPPKPAPIVPRRETVHTAAVVNAASCDKPSIRRPRAAPTRRERCCSSF
jgi:protein TonB